MAGDTKDFISRIGELLSIDREEVIKALDTLDVDTTMDVLDAVSQDDATRVSELMNDTSGNEAQSSEEEDVEELNPLFTREKRRKKKKDVEVDETINDFRPNIGDPVSVGDSEGVVKVTNGPNETLGVMIDGELTMVNRNMVKPLKEGLLGMTNMPGLQRMQALAGILPADIAPVEVTAQSTTVVPPTDEATGCPLEHVMCLFAEIEKALPTLQIRDGKAVRERLNGLMMKLNESRQTTKKRI